MLNNVLKDAFPPVRELNRLNRAARISHVISGAAIESARTVTIVAVAAALTADAGMSAAFGILCKVSSVNSLILGSVSTAMSKLIPRRRITISGEYIKLRVNGYTYHKRR